MVSVSVIIPVKNGADTLDRCLSSIRNQNIPGIEIIVLDSMSTDRSREIALKQKANIIDIPEGSFNHGLTRNLGVQHASHELLYLTVQDAWLADNNMLECMVKHFDDPEVMGVVGHQAVPHEKDKNPLVWFKRYSEAITTTRQVKDWSAFEKLPVKEQQGMIAWDNVVAMYRKSALTTIPFVATEFAEDWIWSEQALQKGWKLIHDPSLITWHYHHRGFKYAFKLAYAMNYHFHKFLHYTPKLPALLKPMIEATYHISKNTRISLKERIYWIRHNYAGLLGNFMSHINFLYRFKFGGEKAVEKGYNKYCEAIPQGKQKRA